VNDKPNIYHRYLQLPFAIKPPAFFEQRGDIIKHLVLDHLKHPDIDDLFRQLGLACARKECFYTPPYGKIPIHTDHSSYTNHVKINVTWGPEAGVIQWYESDLVEERVISGGTENTEAYHHNLWAREEDATLVREACTNRPSLVNVGILHGTHNPSPEGRWTLCFTPWNPTRRSMVEWNEGLRLFAPYIVTK